MKSKTKNICIVIERNTQIEKIINDNFIDLEANADKNFLENQIINLSYFDESNEKEEDFFRVYVQRYLNHIDNIKRSKKYKSDDVSALLVIRVNDEDKSDIRSFIELSFHENYDEMCAEVTKVQYMTLMRCMNKIRERRLNLQNSM
jgi:hypothetical protein